MIFFVHSVACQCATGFLSGKSRRDRLMLLREATRCDHPQHPHCDENGSPQPLRSLGMSESHWRNGIAVPFKLRMTAVRRQKRRPISKSYWNCNSLLIYRAFSFLTLNNFYGMITPNNFLVILSKIPFWTTKIARTAERQWLFRDKYP